MPLDTPWLKWLEECLPILRGDAAPEPLWGFTYREVVKEFIRIRTLFGIPDLVPYGLRHAGASLDRSSRSRTLLEVQKRGRWQQLRSVQRYEKGGRLAATAATYSSNFVAYAKTCEKYLDQYVLGLRPLPPPYAR